MKLHTDQAGQVGQLGGVLTKATEQARHPTCRPKARLHAQRERE